MLTTRPTSSCLVITIYSAVVRMAAEAVEPVEVGVEAAVVDVGEAVVGAEANHEQQQSWSRHRLAA